MKRQMGSGVPMFVGNQKIFVMKSIIIVLLSFVVFSTNGWAQSAKPSPEANALLGSWNLDMTPTDKTDVNFATMEITKVNGNEINGSFYSTNVRFREGTINSQNGRIYAALVSGDGSGAYHTSFYYEDGKLYGTTHSIGRDFLSIWEAEKMD
jgi:hypothetical protein